MKLYICGNGLDIHHGLRTSYPYYRKWLIDNGYKKIVDDYEGLNCSTDLWKDIEDSIGKEWQNMIYEKMYQYKTEGGCLDEDELQYDIYYGYRFIFAFTGELFYKWLWSLDNTGIRPDMGFENNSLYVNFNYTNTLEDVYHIAPELVFHIHGDMKNIKDEDCLSYSYFSYRGDPELTLINKPDMDHYEWNSDIIRKEIQFGGTSISLGDVERELSRWFPQNNESNENYQDLLELTSKVIKQPEANFRKLTEFLDSKDINEVIVVGLSIGNSDKEYFQKIFLPKYSYLKWSFYFHNSENKKYYEEYAQSNGISNCRFIPYP